MPRRGVTRRGVTGRAVTQRSVTGGGGRDGVLVTAGRGRGVNRPSGSGRAHIRGFGDRRQRRGRAGHRSRRGRIAGGSRRRCGWCRRRSRGCHGRGGGSGGSGPCRGADVRPVGGRRRAGGPGLGAAGSRRGRSRPGHGGRGDVRHQRRSGLRRHPRRAADGAVFANVSGRRPEPPPASGARHAPVRPLMPTASTIGAARLRAKPRPAKGGTPDLPNSPRREWAPGATRGVGGGVSPAGGAAGSEAPPGRPRGAAPGPWSPRGR